MTPQQSRKIGRIFFLVMLGTMGVLLLWDAVAQFGFGLKYTVSWAIWEASVSAPIIPFLVGWALGLFGGHLFWSGYADSQKEIQALTDALVRAKGLLKCTCQSFAEMPCPGCDLEDDIRSTLEEIK